MSETAVARLPVYNPRPTLRIDEQEFDRIRELVIAMDVREQENGLSTLELRLRNMFSEVSGGAGFAFENEEELKLGSTLALYSGDLTEPQEIFRGRVTGMETEFPEEGPPEIVIYAEDQLQLLRMKRRTRLFADQSLASIAETIASDHGMASTITGLSDSSGNWMQLNESDLAFLRRIAQRFDADVQIVGEELQLSPVNDVQRGELELRLRGQLRSARFFADLSHQLNSVTVTGWNPDTGQRINETSTGRNLGPGSGRLGSEILQQAFFSRNEHIGHIAVNNSEEAVALANSVYDQAARRFVTVEGNTEGNPGLRVGTHVRISGVSPRFENTYYVTRAHHVYNQSRGYETRFCAQSSKLESP
ncbi:Phage protein D [Alteromonadaceae bacterium Bs31]|nr:Phage protein D [Alteromonadaceae bacterium Bs31]